jgi:hypothetical protein
MTGTTSSAQRAFAMPTSHADSRDRKLVNNLGLLRDDRVRSTNRLSHRQIPRVSEADFRIRLPKPDFARYNHPFVLAILAASTRFAAPSLLIASDK